MFSESKAEMKVTIPPDFLAAPPPGPITVKRIDWSQTVLREWESRYAAVLDGVLTPDECKLLIALAEQSTGQAGDDDTSGSGNGTKGWQPAKVSVAQGVDFLATDYRNSDRIIWDDQDVVDRIWGRIRLAEGIEDDLATAEANAAEERDGLEWRFDRVNERMRFLRYGKGQFFKPHNDAAYIEKRDGGGVFKTHFTVHLYLNDSVQEVGDEAGTDLRGGATSFLSNDLKRKVDVDPKAGRVLIFRHRNMHHAGDDVVAGTKFTMRTDILYELVDKRKGKEADERQ